MDQFQWKIIYQTIRKAAGSLSRDRRLKFSDVLIVAMYFWAVKHDRAMMWACDRKNYSSVFRPRRLPSISQFHRRVKSPRVLCILQSVHNALAGVNNPTDILIVDGKALTVNPSTQDPDTRVGYVSAKMMGKGYKLHAYVTEDRRILCWCVRPLNEHEMPIATLMLDHLPPMNDRTLVLADANYDSHSLHKAVAARGGRFVPTLRGKAKHEVTLRQMGAARRELLEINRKARPLVRIVQRERGTIERGFAHLCNYGGGLTSLPPFVRRLPRVRRWVGAKITLLHARQRARKACQLSTD